MTMFAITMLLCNGMGVVVGVAERDLSTIAVCTGGAVCALLLI